MNAEEETRINLIEALIHEKRRTSLAHTQFLSCNREYAPGEQLHMREVHLVVAIGPGPGKTMSELAELLEVTRGAVTQLAGRMEKKGYIIRIQSPEDRRQILAQLTDKGEALCRSHHSYDHTVYQKISRLLSDFSDEELVKIREYERLSRICFTENPDNY